MSFFFLAHPVYIYICKYNTKITINICVNSMIQQGVSDYAFITNFCISLHI